MGDVEEGKLPPQQFLEAQQRYLQRHGVDAESSCIPIPIIQGSAHVLTTGQGPPVVLLNGIGTPAAMWAPLIGRLEGFQLHAVDLPGYGLTDVTSSFSGELRHNAVQFLDEVLAGLGLTSPAFVGNSLGSLWTNWFALEHSEKVSRIVHIGCPALVLGTSAPLPMRLLANRILGRLMTRIQPPSRGQVVELSKMVKQHPLDEELIDLLLETERLPKFRDTFLAMLNVLIRLRGARPSMPLMDKDLAEIGAPTLILWGDADPFGSTDIGGRMAESLPNAELHVMRGGHAPWLSDTQKVADLVSRFLHVQ